MPVKRALRMENRDTCTPAKRPAVDQNFSPLTGTACLQAGNEKASSCESQVPQADGETLQSLRSKMEASIPEFIKARRELEEIVVPAEGSNELRSFFTRGSADLKTELKRHRELASRAQASLTGGDARQNPGQGVKAGSSYEFLRSIMA